MQRAAVPFLIAGALLAGCAAARHDVLATTASQPSSTVGTLPAHEFTSPASSSTMNPVTLPILSTTAVAVSVPSTTQVVTTTTAPLPTPAPPPDESATSTAAPGGSVGSIEIPRLGLSLPFFEGVTLRTLDQGPGHWPGTALPGQAGNVVIAGHRVSHSHPFRHIDLLVPGDQVVFTVDGQRSVYEVTGHDTVTPDQVGIVAQTPEPTATLFACHPPGSTQFRWVVHLKLVG